MRHDDRLATVLRLTPAGPQVARIQYRQLVDLLGTSPADARGALLDQAYVRLGQLSATIPPADRAKALAEPGLRLRSARLVAGLAGGEAEVARAAIGAAALDDEQWLDLIPGLPVPARAMLRGRRDLGDAPRGLLARLGMGDPGLPQVAGEAAATVRLEPEVAPIAPVDAPPAAPVDSLPGAGTASAIGAIVQRIEAFRRTREAQNGGGEAAPGDAPRLPLGEAPVAAAAPVQAFDFASDAEGRIAWADAAVAAMVVGVDLATTGAPGLAGALRLHQPIAGITRLFGAEAIAGTWRIDAAPAFDPRGGRFTGHVGRFRRTVAATPASAAPDSEAERLRQLLHELRTPVNAIQGFAEIIQQQLFGAAPHEYRALAAGIAGDSARLLAGFDELERFARLDSGAIPHEAGEADLAAILRAAVERLAGNATQAHPALTAETIAVATVAMPAIEVERLCWRVLATLIGAAAAGETLEVVLTREGDAWMTRVALPEALARLDTAMLFHAGPAMAVSGPSAGMFGTGFALRLAGLEARAVGGGLDHRDGALWLSVPAHRLGEEAAEIKPTARQFVAQPAG